MNIAIICARKNSKRIKNKNFISVAGKPLINYTVDAAVKSRLFSNIIINTDNKKYIYNKNNNKKVSIYHRPARLAGSKSRVIEVIKEMLSSLNIKLDANIFVLFPTCPLRNSKDIKDAYKIYKKFNCKKQLISVSEYLPSIDVAFYLNKKNLLKNKFLNKYNKSPGNNNHGKFYFCNYGIIILNASKILTIKKLVNENSLHYLMPFDRSIDIDEISQLRIIRKILRK